MQVNVAGLRRNIKNLAHNYTDAQVKVREATSNDHWGPSARIMAEISDLTHNVVAFSEIMNMIWRRLNDHGKNWRHVYKALILLEYLIKTGSEKVAQQCKENIFAIQTLKEFSHYENAKDEGTHIREKANQLVNLLKDDERLKNERLKALKAKERFAQNPSGFGSDGYIDGPTHRDMPAGWQEEPPKPVSELELVRPQTVGEEELQLQLAMAMSREEAEQEEAKRRSDDVRLQLALSQSEQDFKDQVVKPGAKKEEPHSHLLDLLDISLGATSISSPPLGATAANGDPWGTPARAASQLSDPWSGTSSPQIDPWQPAASMRMATASAPLGAIGGMGPSNGGGADTWGLARTQSPSVASGSSTEGWLHSNGGAGAAAMNGNTIGGGGGAMGGGGAGAIGGVDPWLSKSGGHMVGGRASAGAGVVDKVEPADPWLTETSIKPVNIASLAAAPATATTADPWAPKAGAALSDDPWKSGEKGVAKKPSPDLDEFDIITNRKKTGDTSSSAANASNNNNASLLDEMDPLSATNSSSLNATVTNTKKQLKTPQSFLGENSSLVNLDNLIKPVQTQPPSGNAAYNPFSDTIIPPKTNLFQQQQPAVPSINQLKQQQPFAVTINQDPWAPVNNATKASQSTRDFFLNSTVYDDDNESDEFSAGFQSIRANNKYSYTNNTCINSKQMNNNNNNKILQYSKSDYDVFNTSYAGSSDFFNYNNKNNIKNNNSNSRYRVDGPHQFQTQVQIHSHSVDNIQLASDSDTEEKKPSTATTTTVRKEQQVAATANNANPLNAHQQQQPPPLQSSLSSSSSNQYQPFVADFNSKTLHQPNYAALSDVHNTVFGSDSHTPSIFDQTGTNSSAFHQSAAPLTTTNYGNALTAALADMPGVKITPMTTFGGFGPPSSGGNSISGATDFDAMGNAAAAGGGSLFNYGFYEATTSLNSHNNSSSFSNSNNSYNNKNNNSNSISTFNNNNAIYSSSTSTATSPWGNCKLENNNNNMPWMNTEAAASSSNPFLS